MSELLLILTGVHKSKCNLRLTRLSHVKIAPKPRKSTGHDQNLITSKGSQNTSSPQVWDHSLRVFLKIILQKNRVRAYIVTIHKSRHALDPDMFSNWPNCVEIIVSTRQPSCIINIDVLCYFPCHCYSVFPWRLIKCQGYSINLLNRDSPHCPPDMAID